MERKEMIDTLMMLYCRRVKSLLSTDDDSFIRKLIELMFNRFDEISTMDGYEFYKEILESNISGAFMVHTGVKSAQCNVTELVNRLEEYIKLTIKCFWPDKTFKYNPQASEEERQKQDYRKFLGGQIRAMASDTTGKYKFPIELDVATSRQIYRTLYHVTLVRNDKTHLQGAGASAMFVRCHYLETSEILLGYILYTYYYKCLLDNKELL